MSDTEEWRAIPGYEGCYEVSSHGRVRSLDREIPGRWGPHMRRGRVLRQDVDKDGYLKVRPCMNGKARGAFVHRFVLLAFIGPASEGHLALHRDGDPANNKPQNLAWGTYSDNAFDAVKHGTHRQARKTNCPQGHPYDSSNTRMEGDGSRRCIACKRKQDSAWKATRSAARKVLRGAA